MRIGRTCTSMALALSALAACSAVRAADSKPAESKPQGIVFSRPEGAKVAKPGAKTGDPLARYGNVPEAAKGSTLPDLAPSLSTAPVLPSRATQEKMAEELDRKRNWLVPGAQKTGTDSLESEANLDKWEGLEKKEGVMREFLSSDDEKKSRLRESREGREAQRNREKAPGARDRDGRAANDEHDNDPNSRDDRDRDKERDPNSNKESNGLADFNLKNYIRFQNSQTEFLKDNQLPKASQLFKSELGNLSGVSQIDQQRGQLRDRDAANSAEFNKLLKPRTSPTLVGVTDPLGAPDLSRREMNPVMPRMNDSGESRSSFPAASAPAARIQESGIFGVTGPAAASSIAPIVNVPSPARPDIMQRSQSIIHEAPRRGF